MSITSSRTPAGEPAHCPVCNAGVVVLTAAPLADAPCPKCGTLIWPIATEAGDFWFVAREFTDAQKAKLRELAPRLEGADSLELVEILMDLEDMLQASISIPDELMNRGDSTDAVVRHVIGWLQRGMGDEAPAV